MSCAILDSATIVLYRAFQQCTTSVDQNQLSLVTVGAQSVDPFW